jgi:hypothetical protein
MSQAASSTHLTTGYGEAADPTSERTGRTTLSILSHLRAARVVAWTVYRTLRTLNPIKKTLQNRIAPRAGGGHSLHQISRSSQHRRAIECSGATSVNPPSTTIASLKDALHRPMDIPERYLIWGFKRGGTPPKRHTRPSHKTLTMFDVL